MKKERYQKQFFEYFKEVLNYKNFSIYDVEHSVARYHERVNKDISFYENLLKKGIEWIIKNKKETIEDRYIFVSKKHGFGIQIHWRNDRSTNQFNGYSATTLSENEMKFFKEKDKQIFLERTYKRITLEESLQKEFDFCGFDIFTENSKMYYTFNVVEL